MPVSFTRNKESVQKFEEREILMYIYQNETGKCFQNDLAYAYFKYLLTLAGIYLLKINNRNTRTRREICSKLTIKAPERRPLLLTLNILHTLF